MSVEGIHFGSHSVNVLEGIQLYISRCEKPHRPAIAKGPIAITEPCNCLFFNFLLSIVILAEKLAETARIIK